MKEVPHPFKEKKESLLLLASEAAREAGRLLREDFSRNPGVRSNAGKDVKTSADVASEALIRRLLEATGVQILGEESVEGPPINRAESFWVVDPLDGTFNFSRGFPLCCVSIAYCEDLRPCLGVVYDFQSDILYTGLSGRGAFVNGSPIKVSVINDQGQAVLATGFPAGRSFEGAALRDFVRRIQEFKKIRMIGSAALSLAYVASGSFDAYFEESIWWWDVAAGLALVEAAGGCWSTGDIGADWKADIRAWNGCFGKDF
jgi:myo-inositol-1(or 4)-monophosphatase